ncbi:M2 family metallopeptidase [Candidatus Foliamicus sp.]
MNRRVILAALAITVLAAASTPDAPLLSADEFIRQTNEKYEEMRLEGAAAAWAHATYINADTALLASRAQERSLKFQSEAVEGARRYDGAELDPLTQRAINAIKWGATLPAPNEDAKRRELSEIMTRMEGAYGSGKYCPDGPESCRDLEELSEVMARSRNHDELLEAWRGWRTISPPYRADYQRFVELGNEGARELGFNDMGELWRSGYDMPVTDFRDEVERLWGQVSPLYEELHCYTADKLRRAYGESMVPENEPIPAHILGNMWSQTWGEIYDLAEPYAGVAELDVTQAMRDQKYSAVYMTELAEDFFVSLGMPKLPKSFWERSLLVKPRDRDVVCHASAWSMDAKDDVRIKMCIEPTQENLFTIYHELGHIYYFLAYRDQPIVFQSGAHDGFHEAVGDTVTLSMTPEFLRNLGLVEETMNSHEALINSQMKQALDKIAFLPFGKLMDQWRWGVFSGEIAPEDYNAAWWDLRTRYQGIRPPVDRSENDFDPGAKYHIPGNTPYTRYFLAFVLQFQMQRALCEAAGFDGPLHECSLYGNKKAGALLWEMLEQGSRQPWQDTLEAATGQRVMDASAIIAYFQPLMDWLETENQGLSCGW